MKTKLIGTITPLILVLALQAQSLSSDAYFQDFEGPVGSEWSARPTTLYPYGTFLGEFGGSDTVTLTLSNLPTHTNLLVAFDLLTLKRWRGNNTSDGLATWELRVVGQNTPLIRTTFSTDTGFNQSFPANHHAVNPARTGAFESNTLGFRRVGGDVVRDAFYKLQFRVAHTNESIQLQFLGTGLPTIDDQSWALDNVFVGTNDSPFAPTFRSNGLVLAESTFDAGQDGWSDWDANGNRAPVTYHPTNGASGGYISLDEVGSGDGATTFWTASTNFLGDQRQAFGGIIEFKAKQNSRDSQSGMLNKKCVILIGDGLRLNYTSPFRPSDVWTHFAVPLLPAFWQIDDDNGPNATLEQMMRVLGNLSTLRIRAEYRSGNDVDSLDEVRLLSGRADALAPLFIRPGFNNTVAVHWPASRTALKLQSAGNLGGAYNDVTAVSETMTNGLHTVYVNASETNKFFRLVKSE